MRHRTTPGAGVESELVPEVIRAYRDSIAVGLVLRMFKTDCRRPPIEQVSPERKDSAR